MFIWFASNRKHNFVFSNMNGPKKIQTNRRLRITALIQFSSMPYLI